MSILTGAELAGGLPPPRIGTFADQTDREAETSARGIPFSSEAAILKLTNTVARNVVQRGQELVDRRNEKNAAEQEQARKAAAEEARQRSLEKQGLKEPEPAADQALVNTAQPGETSEGDGPDATEPSSGSQGAVAFAAETSDGRQAAGDDQQVAGAAADAVRLDVLA